MKKLSLVLLIACCSAHYNLYPNAVAIVNATDKTVFQLLTSFVEVNVVNQVAIVKSVQTFQNTQDSASHIKYAFPLYEDATAVSLRWYVNGQWFSASFSPSPPDTILPATGEISPDIDTYLGETPLYFTLEDSILPDSIIVFELTYVQLLHYAYNVVSFSYPNNYTYIQELPLDSQTLSMHVVSDRSIVSTNMISHDPSSISFTDNSSDVYVEIIEALASNDYYYEYTLNPDELGLFSFSTYLPDSMNSCDNFGNGFFAFIVEPDPGDSVIIEKVFTLIIDKSGSMSGEKIEQAKDAAGFIIENLNLGDDFNIIDFSSDVFSLFGGHSPVSIANQTTALNYVDDLYSDGGTNISGAFEVAIPEFAYSDPEKSNIIIFLTDGEATAGETSTSGILSIIANSIVEHEVEGISINTFGIGYGANEALLSQIASENNGIFAAFASGDLLEIVTEFYLSIQNPVLLNTNMSFDPPIIYEAYPSPLPNLYKGHQLIVLGRYNEPGMITVIFTGDKYGDSVTYTYTFELTDSLIEQNLFLTKLWAIEKIDHMMTEYYTFGIGSSEADSIEDMITDMSLCYGVISPFTSFTDNTGSTGTVELEEMNVQVKNSQFSVFPNPFKEIVHISFYTTALYENVPCIIYDMSGKVVQVLSVYVNQEGDYEYIWNGIDIHGNEAKPGIYICKSEMNGKIYYGYIEKM